MKASFKAFALAFLSWLAATLPATSLHAASLMENLGRGVIAVRASSTDTFVGWRLLGTDASDIAFNLYRSTNGGPPTLLNSSPIAGATHFTDATADLTQSNAYFVRPIVFGIEQPPSAAFTLGANSPVQQYLRVPLQRPANGVTPIGEGYSYTPNDTSAGDLDGDGEYELILKWEPTNARDSSNDGYTGNTYIDAYKFDGTRLWRIDLGVNIRAGAHDTPFIVYDFDGDGRAEIAMRTCAGTVDGAGSFVAEPTKFQGAYPSEPFSHTADYRNTAGRALVGPEFLTVFDGLTGAELVSTKFLPARHPDTDFPTSAQLQSIWGDTSGNRQGRFYPPGVAYLDGQRPSIVMGRGYASGQGGHPGRVAVAAWNWRDGQLTQQWTYDTVGGSGGHSSSVADLDGDGRDDIVYGQVWLRHDGSRIERQDWGHGDALHVSQMDPDRAGQQVFMPHESPGSYGPNALSYEDGVTGQLIFGVQASTDIGRGNAADIDPRFRGFEMWGTGGTGGLYTAQQFVANSVLGPRGTQVSPNKPGPVNHVVWWDGDLLRELLDGTTISKWNWTTETTAAVFAPTGMASNNGTKSNPCLQADLFGDWREEVIWRESTNDAIRIYTTTIPTTHRLYTLMHDRQYREAIAWQNVGYNQPPHPSFFIGDGMAPAPTPNIVTSLSTLLGPPPPVFTAIATDAGASATDFVTNDPTLVLSGTVTPNTTVTLTRLGVGVIGTALADAGGNWSFDYTGTPLPDGETRFTGTASDTSNTGAPSSPFAVTIDTVAPAAPVITDISSTSSLHFAGTAEPASTVTVMRTGFGAIGTAVTSASGNWSLDYTGPALPPGEHAFTATATDVAGNTSVDSVSSSVDTTITTPTIASVSTDTGVSATDGITSDNTLVFTGTAGAGNTVTLTRAGSGTIGTTAANASGEWTIDYTGTTLGDGIYSFSARASSGGSTSSPSSPTAVVTVDTAAPGVVSVNRLNPSVAISSSDTITFRVTFTESVTEVGAIDFTPVFSGGLSGTIATVAAAGGTAFDVSLSLSGEGSVRLDVNAGGIHDIAGNTLPAAFTTGQTYTRSMTGNGVWVQADGGLWSTNANWENGIVGDGVGNTANFSTIDAAETVAVQLDSPRSIGNLVFGDTEVASPGSWIVDDQGNAANVLTLAVASGTPTVQVNPLGAGAVVTIAARLAGNQGLNKVGTGPLVLTGANTFAGAHNINAGTLRIGVGATHSATSVNIASGSGVLDIAGGTFTASGTTTANGTGGTLVVNSGTGTFNAVNTNNSANGLIRVNGGTFTATSINIPRSSDATASFAFGFVVTGGTATVSGPVGLGTNNSWGSMSIEGGVANVGGAISVGFMSGTGARGGQMRVTGGVFNSTDTVDGLIVARRSTSGASSGNAFFPGGVSTVEKIQMSLGPLTGGAAALTVNGGTLYLGSGGIVKSGPAAFPTTLTLQSGIVGAKAGWSTTHPIVLPAGGSIALQTADAANAPFNIALDGVLSGPGGFAKTGTGILTLSAANTFTGSANVDAGTLNLTGSLAAGGSVNVNTGGTLAGTGSSAKAISLNAGGTVAPGGPAIANLSGSSLTWHGGGVLAADLGGNGVSDQLALSGALTRGADGTYTVALNATEPLAPGFQYTVATFGSTDFAPNEIATTGLPDGFAGRALIVGGAQLRIVIVARPVIASATSASGTYGQPFTYSILADNEPASFSASGLPPGLTLDPLTGVISGTLGAAGTFNVALGATNEAGTGTATLTLIVAPAPVIIAIGGSGNNTQSLGYDGTPKTPSIATTPAGLPVSFTYNGSSTPPTLPGTYEVVATSADPNYAGSTTGTLVITIGALVRHVTLNGDVDGSLQVLTAENVTLNGGAMVSGDLLVRGTPTVRLNGNPTYGSTLDAAGSASPSTFTVTLNGGAVLRHVVRRVDAIPIPTVAAPPQPTGTRSVSLNHSSQSPGDFATLRNLTLNSNVGPIAVPAGTYGNFNANSHSGFVLGVTGATAPAVYHFQNLTLNSNATLQVLGPVIVILNGGFSTNALLGSAAHPEWLQLNIAGGGLSLASSVTVHALVLAPNGTVTLNGNATLHGRVTADRLIVNGNAVLDEVP